MPDTTTTSGRDLVSRLEGLAARHDSWRAQCLNLDSAESASSLRATRPLVSDLAQRASGGTIGIRGHRGIRYIDEIERVATELFRRLFRARYAELQIPTGSVANGIALRLLTETGDVILRPSVPRAHPTFGEAGYAGHRGLRIHDIPLDPSTYSVDLDRLAEQVRRTRPTVICLGTAVMLFPYPLAEIAEIAAQAGARIVYDGAHVMGLIASGRFQDPLREGADILTGTGYKTFSGPAGGLLLHNDPEIDSRLRPLLGGCGYVGTYNPARIMAMAITAAEHLDFGAGFSDRMVGNARRLAASLDNLGLPPVGRDLGYTASSTILLDVTEHGTGSEISRRLEEANIITMGTRLWDEPGPGNGLRLATHEMTRLGMKEDSMPLVAGLIKRVVLDGESPESVRRDTVALRSEFTKVEYSFDGEIDMASRRELR